MITYPIFNPNRAAALPTSGLLSALDGSVATSFYSDIAKTTNSTEGGAVAVWEDQSGNGNDWTQSNASAQPVAHLSAGRLYNVGTAGDPVEDYLIGPNISAWTEGSFFARVQAVNAVANGGIWGVTSKSSTTTTAHWGPLNHYVIFGGSTRAQEFNFFPNGGVVYNDLMTYEENSDTNALTKIYINGTERYSADLGTRGFRTAPYLGCGIRLNVPYYSGAWHFYKFCAYNRIVSASDRTAIIAWLES